MINTWSGSFTTHVETKALPKSLFRTLAALGLLCLLCGSSASAAIIASDSFAYPTGSALAGNNGGAGWGGAWTATQSPDTKATVIDASGNPLEFTPAGGLAISGGNEALEVKRDVNTTGNHRAGARALASPLQQTFYAGYLLRYDGPDFGGSNNTFSLHLADSDSNQNSFNFGIRGNTPGSATAPPAGGPQEFIVRSGTGAPVAGAFGGGEVVNGQEYFLLAKLTYSGTNYDQIDVWINPAVNPGAPHLTLSLAPGTGLTQISHLFFRQAATQPDANDPSIDVFVADGLVISDDVTDVLVPEPSTVTLIAAFGVVLFCLSARACPPRLRVA
jgi:hypothetical protein